MQTCEGCGALSAEDARFCSSCGKPSSGGDPGYDTPTLALETEVPAIRESPHPPQRGAFAPGTVLARRYRIVALLGRGGMGEVYRAEDLKLGNTVALKFLAPALQDDPNALAHLHDEVRNAREVSHPNVCRVYDIGEVGSGPGGQHFLTMEYVDGEDLAALLRRIGRLPADKALETSQQICAGLAAAHDAGLLHRDLKPANIMLDGRGRVRITDFGLALETGNQHRGTGKANAGTPPYMAPEQIARGETSVRSDIYALGLVLYEIFTGTLPYKAVPPDTWLRVHREAIPIAPSSLARDIDPAVESTILACLRKNPSERPASVREVAAALPAAHGASPSSRAAAGSEGLRTPSRTPARFASSPAQAAPPPPLWRRPWMLFSSAAVLLILVAAAAYFLLSQRRLYEHYSMQKAIDSQRVRTNSISPDGNYIAFVVLNAQGNESLWVHNIPTNSERAILPDGAFRYQDVIFSPDASYVYFSARAASPGHDDVYRVPVLGGTPSRIFENIGAPLSFIDKGRRVCLYREEENSQSYKFISASADGGDERTLYTGWPPYPEIPACSPDGTSAVVEDDTGKLEILKFAQGTRQTLATAAQGRWFYSLQWNPNGKGIFTVTVQKFHYSGQLGYLTYPGGQFSQITNDLNNYSGISVTSDARTLATTQKDRNTHFIDLSLANPTRFDEHHLGDIEWFTWADADRLFVSGDDSVLKSADLLKDETSTLNVPRDHFFLQPAPCGPDALVASGNTLDQKNPGIYKMQLDGAVATRLTTGQQDLWPQCSPDGSQLFYADDHDENHLRLMHLALNGPAGTSPQPFAQGIYFRIARDGNLLALHDVDNTSRLQLYSPKTLQLLKTLPMPPKSSFFIALAPDNKAIFYFTRNEAGSILWRMPFDNTPPTQLASFPGRILKYMQASPDGTRLGIVAQEPQAQVLLLHDIH